VNQADGTSDLTAVLTALSCNEPDPAAEAQFRDQVDRLCANLDDAEKQILDQRLEGYTPAEIAERIGVSRVALRVRLTRLRQRLQAAGVVTDWL
jgi:RNA polymerase sigma factor (sigma-70 family)